MYRHFATLIIEHLEKLSKAMTDEIEDMARLLAQALVGEGHIYFFAEGELRGVFLQARDGKEPFQPAERIQELSLEELDTLTSADRVLIISQDADDENTLRVARYLYDAHIPFGAVASAKGKEVQLEHLADVYIDLGLYAGLIPRGFAQLEGYPHLLAALFIYHQIHFQLQDLFADII